MTRKRWLYVLAAFLVIGVIGNIFGGGSSKNAQEATASIPAASAPTAVSQPTLFPTPPVAPTAVPTAPPTPTATPDKQITTAIQAAHLFGKLDKLQVSPSAGEAGKWIVDTHLAIADNLNSNMIVGGALMDYLTICKAAYMTGVPIQWVAFTGAFPMKDTYGNTKVEDIVVLKLPEATAVKINWSGITYEDLWKITDKIIVYPAFAKDAPAS